LELICDFPSTFIESTMRRAAILGCTTAFQPSPEAGLFSAYVERGAVPKWD
jgi:hypothetical protein